MNNLKFNLAKETFEDGLLNRTSYVLTVDTTCTAGTLFTNDCNDKRNNISDVDYMFMFVSMMVNEDFSVEEAFDELMKKELRLKDYDFLTNRHIEILTYMSDALKQIVTMCDGSLFSEYSKYLAELLDLQISMEFVVPKALYLTNPVWINTSADIRKQVLNARLSELSIIFNPTPIDKKKLTELYREFCEECGSLPLYGKENSIVLRTNGFIDTNLTDSDYESLCYHLFQILKNAQFRLSKFSKGLTVEDLNLIFVISAYLSRTEIYSSKEYNKYTLKVNDEIEIASRGEYHVLAMFKGCMKICIENNYPPMMIASYMRMLGENVSDNLRLFLNSTMNNPVNHLYIAYATRVLSSLYNLEEKDYPLNPTLLYNSDNSNELYVLHRKILLCSSSNSELIYMNLDKITLDIINNLIPSGEINKDSIVDFNSSGDIVIRKSGVKDIDRALRKVMF